MGKSKADHFVAIAKAGLSVVSPVGGAIASLISEYIPSATMRAEESAIKQLGERLSAMEDRLDPDAVNREEFAELFKSSYLIFVRTHQSEKVEAALSIIENILLRDSDPQKMSFDELDHFSRAIDSLSIGAYHVLAEAYRIAMDTRVKDAETQSHSITFDSLRNAMPDTEPSLLMGLVGELNAMNLLHLPGSPTVRTPGYGNYSVELPAIGAAFVERIMKRGA